MTHFFDDIGIRASLFGGVATAIFLVSSAATADTNSNLNEEDFNEIITMIIENTECIDLPDYIYVGFPPERIQIGETTYCDVKFPYALEIFPKVNNPTPFLSPELFISSLTNAKRMISGVNHEIGFPEIINNAYSFK